MNLGPYPGYHLGDGLRPGRGAEYGTLPGAVMGKEFPFSLNCRQRQTAIDMIVTSPSATPRTMLMVAEAFGLSESQTRIENGKY